MSTSLMRFIQSLCMLSSAQGFKVPAPLCEVGLGDVLSELDDRNDLGLEEKAAQGAAYARSGCVPQGLQRKPSARGCRAFHLFSHE